MTARGLVDPVAGEQFQLAATAPVAGSPERRKLLCLLAAFSDAGESSPPVRVLAKRIGVPQGGIDLLLKRLEEDGLLVVHWRAGEGDRNVYELKLRGGGGGA